jgi:Glycosyl hydrolase family 47
MRSATVAAAILAAASRECPATSFPTPDRADFDISHSLVRVDPLRPSLISWLPGLLYLTLSLPETHMALSNERRARYRDAAEGLTKTCVKMYSTPSGLASETMTVGLDLSKSHDGEYNLRPEVVEALFYESRLADSTDVRESARQSAWEIFLAIEEHCKTEYGYAGLARPGEPLSEGESAFVKTDRQHSFLLAETFKYELTASCLSICIDVHAKHALA